jgi:hypothetical protein
MFYYFFLCLLLLYLGLTKKTLRAGSQLRGCDSPEPITCANRNIATLPTPITDAKYTSS